MGFRCSGNDFGGVPYSGDVFGVFVVSATVLVVALCSGVVLVLAVAPVSILVVVICCSGDDVRGVVFSGFCLFVLFWWWALVLAYLVLMFRGTSSKASHSCNFCPLRRFCVAFGFVPVCVGVSCALVSFLAG
ncbi:hypothetical protein TSUD_132970 [Trifolium subterraneum]|uniref:Transmembrane protein n=1 Tax=Trifolium subterraneum TaxID=3900 RepID=A0A2Z6MQ04_TRISU|nr:hypothetical protein TSUD_132970 [Trifolium subterraneum]